MEDYRLIEIEEDQEEEFEDEDEEDYDDGDYGEELIPEGLLSSRGSRFNFNAGEEDNEEEEEDEDEDDDEEEEEEDYEERQEAEEFFPVPMMLPRGRISFPDAGEQEDEDYEEEYEDEDEDEEDYEEEEGEEFIPVGMMSPRFSNSTSDGRTSQGAVVINEGLLTDSNDSESRDRKPVNQENGGGHGGEAELSRGEIDGLFCPICFEAWTSGGDHQICCLPCGHIYGLSCIKKWLQRCGSSGKCPQCNGLCTLKDIRVLYGARLCWADAEFQKRFQLLEARCALLEQKVSSQAVPLTPEELINQICNSPTLVRRLAMALAGLHQQQEGQWQDFP